MLARPMALPQEKSARAGAIACDEALFERLRSLRKRIADERDVPAYVIFSDVSLRHMAREYPSSEESFARISGVGEKKRLEFAAPFLAEIADHLRNNPRQIFADDSFVLSPANARAGMSDTIRETVKRFQAGASVEQIAAQRSLVPGTIYSHLASGIQSGELRDAGRFFTPEEQRELEGAFARGDHATLTDIREFLGERYDFDRLRIFRAFKNTEARAGRS
jgi:ATP-dependent DNA helicase RecQ